MDIALVMAYLLSIFIGISLGLIGGGGSILTVPILVYVAATDPVLATGYSLFVVGATALVGSFAYMRRQLVSYRSAIVFGIPSIVAVYLTRALLIPAIPEVVFVIGAFEVTRDIAIMIFFAIIMVLAAVSMMRGKSEKANEAVAIENEEKPEIKPKFNYPLILAEGTVVGVVTGLVGAGGGFLIIPALVLLAKLPMKLAVGTSLLIIAAKSLIGFTGDLTTDNPIDWGFLLLFTAFAVVGIFVGSSLSTRIDGQYLKKGFGWFVLIMGIYIIGREILFA